ncbi:NADPH-dependent FMN reductase [Undibacterium sp. Di27W]|uniref:NADPH-dependent FMN reductase n=1 Tax=Undibacterium sp. Di27W TaxID=3413036 RepID=UPI003BF44B14
MKILAICGSLRTASLNGMLIRAIARLAPADIEVLPYAGMGSLPLFNPDLDLIPPASVQDLKAQITAANVVLIASPEYAHGVTGVIKNALDWTVSSDVFVNKPVMVLNASPRATHADAALRETLSVMSAYIMQAASIKLPVIGAGLDEDGLLNSQLISTSVRIALTAARAEWKVHQDRLSSGS